MKNNFFYVINLNMRDVKRLMPHKLHEVFFPVSIF